MSSKKLYLLSPIAYETLKDSVYKSVKKLILTHELPLGSRIKDDEIAHQLGVSRTPVREAIHSLIRDGLVEAKPRSQTRVRMLSESDIDEIFDLRIALESLATRLSIERIPSAELERLNHLHTLAEAGIKKNDSRPALHFDSEMHSVIIKNCGNNRLIAIMQNINDYVTLFRNLSERTPAHRGFNYRHREIVRALNREDGEAAARAIEDHILMAKEQTQRDFVQHQLHNSKEGRPQTEKRRRKSEVIA
jgi:DNA-binding GntR family transcriptional regulator